ncbi:MAG: hypothetical protein ACRDPZ_03665 [Gaiellaceae bacterium]
MPIPRKGDQRADADFVVATDDVARLEAEVGPLVERAVGVPWYEIGNDSDVAALALCRLRRSRSGLRGATSHGDAAVRDALSSVQPEALVWIASRAISYMDENGFPEAIEPYV